MLSPHDRISCINNENDHKQTLKYLFMGSLYMYNEPYYIFLLLAISAVKNVFIGVAMRYQDDLKMFLLFFTVHIIAKILFDYVKYSELRFREYEGITSMTKHLQGLTFEQVSKYSVDQYSQMYQYIMFKYPQHIYKAYTIVMLDNFVQIVIQLFNLYNTSKRLTIVLLLLSPLFIITNKIVYKKK